ncbi:MAG: DNA-directed RNA polymerase subunit omega, partial [candidate division NC10 bacterium]|nr:DNA-directed RNA polymerase subunit omega [candidate division NC10 bacterium]
MTLRLVDDLPDGIDSKYRLVHIAGKRAKQIMRGSLPLIDTKALKPTLIALEEVVAGKVKIEAPPPEWEAAQAKQAAQEARGAWFRHIPPEELIPAHLVSGEEKGEGEALELEGEGEEYGPELEEQEGELEEGVEEFDPLSHGALDEHIEGM